MFFFFVFFCLHDLLVYQCGLTFCVHFVPNRVLHDKVKDWGQGTV